MGKPNLSRCSKCGTIFWNEGVRDAHEANCGGTK